jgi:hypothetical protein
MESYARGPQFALTTNTAHQTFSETSRRFPDLNSLLLLLATVRLT